MLFLSILALVKFIWYIDGQQYLNRSIRQIGDFSNYTFWMLLLPVLSGIVFTITYARLRPKDSIGQSIAFLLNLLGI